MPDKPHPLTNIAKIRRGHTAIARQGADLSFPESSDFLSETDALRDELRKVSQVNVNKGIIATWWNRKQVYQVVELLTEKLAAAERIQSLRKIEAEARRKEYLEQATVQVERMLLENQAQVLAEATAMGISAMEYGQYTLKRLETQLQIEAKEIQVKADLRLERATLEETYKAVLAKSAVTFQHQRQIIDDIAELETDLHNLDSENLPAAVKESKKKRLQNLIATKEAELASKSEAVSAGDGGRPRQHTEIQADPERPTE